MCDLDPSRRAALLALARDAIGARLLGGPRPEVADALRFHAGGAFVTVHVDGELRGCIGSLVAREPVGDIVRRCAAAAAFEDPRFPPIRLSELPSLTVQISVLTAPEPAGDPPAIVVGRHGVVVERGSRRGLLLPQVAAEHGWSAGELLRQTCVKAGLPPEDWKTGASVYRFEAEVFGDEEVL